MCLLLDIQPKSTIWVLALSHFCDNDRFVFKLKSMFLQSDKVSPSIQHRSFKHLGLQRPWKWSWLVWLSIERRIQRSWVPFPYWVNGILLKLLQSKIPGVAHKGYWAAFDWWALDPSCSTGKWFGLFGTKFQRNCAEPFFYTKRSLTLNHWWATISTKSMVFRIIVFEMFKNWGCGLRPRFG